MKLSVAVQKRYPRCTHYIRRVLPRVVPILGVKILHEMAHWGDWKDGIHYNGEEGNAFETLVYGKIVHI